MVVKPLKFEGNTSNSFPLIAISIKNTMGEFSGSALRAASREVSMGVTRYFFLYIELYCC